MGGGQERDRLPHRTDSDSDSNIEKKSADLFASVSSPRFA
jgi:hypothetical protein